MENLISVILAVIVSAVSLISCGVGNEPQKALNSESGAKHLISDDGNDDKNSDKNKRKADIPKGETTVIVFKAGKDNQTSENMEDIKKVLLNRLDGLGYYDSEITVSEMNKIEVCVPYLKDAEEVAETLGQAAKLKFSDESGNTILDGESIKSAEADKEEVNGTAQYSVTIEFTKQGRKKFAKATAQNIGKPIYIMLDDCVITAPTVQSEIDSDSCTITGDFTEDGAKSLAANIKSGQLPFSLTVEEIYKK